MLIMWPYFAFLMFKASKPHRVLISEVSKKAPQLSEVIDLSKGNARAFATFIARQKRFKQFLYGEELDEHPAVKQAKEIYRPLNTKIMRVQRAWFICVVFGMLVGAVSMTLDARGIAYIAVPRPPSR